MPKNNKINESSPEATEISLEGTKLSVRQPNGDVEEGDKPLFGSYNIRTGVMREFYSLCRFLGRPNPEYGNHITRAMDMYNKKVLRPAMLKLKAEYPPIQFTCPNDKKEDVSPSYRKYAWVQFDPESGKGYEKPKECVCGKKHDMVLVSDVDIKKVPKPQDIVNEVVDEYWEVVMKDKKAHTALRMWHCPKEENLKPEFKTVSSRSVDVPDCPCGGTDHKPIVHEDFLKELEKKRKKREEDEKKDNSIKMG